MGMNTGNAVSVTCGPTFDWGDRMRKIRRDVAHLSQTQMAELLGVKAATYAAWEGGRAKPHAKLAERVAMRLQQRFAGRLSAAWVLGYAIDATGEPATFLALIGEDQEEPLPWMESNHQPSGVRRYAGQRPPGTSPFGAVRKCS